MANNSSNNILSMYNMKAWLKKVLHYILTYLYITINLMDNLVENFILFFVSKNKTRQLYQVGNIFSTERHGSVVKDGIGYGMSEV